MNVKKANYLLKKTIEDYNKIASQFSSTRNFLSADLVALKKYTKEGDKILDLGCGNGRLSELFSTTDYLGGDDSEALVEIAKQRYPDKKFVLFEPLEIAAKDESFDVVFCLSVFHHIPSHQYRLQYLREIQRVLKPGGTIVLTVWNIWKIKGMFWKILRDSFFYPYLDLNDAYLPFKNSQGEILVKRYIHGFHDEELMQLFDDVGFRQINQEFQTRGRKAENENILVSGLK